MASGASARSTRRCPGRVEARPLAEHVGVPAALHHAPVGLVAVHGRDHAAAAGGDPVVPVVSVLRVDRGEEQPESWSKASALRLHRFIIGALVFVIALMLVERVYFSDDDPVATNTGPAAQIERSVAVLPFDDFSQQQDQQQESQEDQEQQQENQPTPTPSPSGAEAAPTPTPTSSEPLFSASWAARSHAG